MFWLITQNGMKIPFSSFLQQNVLDNHYTKHARFWFRVQFCFQEMNMLRNNLCFQVKFKWWQIVDVCGLFLSVKFLSVGQFYQIWQNWRVLAPKSLALAENWLNCRNKASFLLIFTKSVEPIFQSDELISRLRVLGGTFLTFWHPLMVLDH